MDMQFIVGVITIIASMRGEIKMCAECEVKGPEWPPRHI